MLANLRELPERQRATLVLSELHGLSQAEIATVLGVRSEQVKAYAYQARSNLISEKVAREADCTDIRKELATARGAALRKRRLRRHLRTCGGCREYEDAIAGQRRRFAALMPVVPSLALKMRALQDMIDNAGVPGVYVGGTAVGGSVAGTAVIAGGGMKALVAKVAAGRRRGRRRLRCRRRRARRLARLRKRRVRHRGAALCVSPPPRAARAAAATSAPRAKGPHRAVARQRADASPAAGRAASRTPGGRCSPARSPISAPVVAAARARRRKATARAANPRPSPLRAVARAIPARPKKHASSKAKNVPRKPKNTSTTRKNTSANRKKASARTKKNGTGGRISPAADRRRTRTQTRRKTLR